MILHQTRSPEDWKVHLAKGQDHWRAGFSAMETAHSWETAKGLPAEIQKLFPRAELLQAIVEYPVSLPGGRTDSMNDVFALLSDENGLLVCMVEAKRNEPFGEMIQDWQRNQSPGKTLRFEYLCKVLGISDEELSGTQRYQLFHRTASAVLTARAYHAERATMIVQSFSSERKWFDDYTRFAALFGIDAKPDVLQFAGTLGGTSLSLGWVTSPLMPGDTPC